MFHTKYSTQQRHQSKPGWLNRFRRVSHPLGILNYTGKDRREVTDSEVSYNLI